MNWGVAFKSESREMASMMVPMLYQREDLRRCEEESQNGFGMVVIWRWRSSIARAEQWKMMDRRESRFSGLTMEM